MALAGAHGADILLWDLLSRSLAKTLSGHAETIKSLAYRRDGRWLASLDGAGTIIVWDVESKDKRVIKTVAFGPSGKVIQRIAFTPDGRHLVTANTNATIYIIRLASPGQ